MKIGILTFHNAVNYGAVLQAYALNNTMRDLGADSELVNYKNKQVANAYKAFNLGGKLTIKNIFKAFVYFPILSVKNRKFRQFISNNIQIGDPVSTKKDLKKVANKYEKFITGSDQIWNYNHTDNDMTYFLDFVSTKSKKYSYAASFGISDISTKFEKKYSKLLDDYNKISVRETQGANIISKLNKKKSYVHLDPVFLIPKEGWLNLCDKKIKEGNFIVVYLMKYSNNLIRLAEELANNLGCEIIYINSSLVRNIKGKYIRTASPTEYLELFAAAKYVITNSFHGTAFSIIFNKKFLVELHSGSNHSNSRLENILETFGIQDRVIKDDRINLTNEIDYKKVNKIIGEKKEESLKYLRSIISTNH